MVAYKIQASWTEVACTVEAAHHFCKRDYIYIYMIMISGTMMWTFMMNNIQNSLWQSKKIFPLGQSPKIETAEMNIKEP
jgi:hypothetical protein